LTRELYFKLSSLSFPRLAFSAPFYYTFFNNCPAIASYLFVARKEIFAMQFTVRDWMMDLIVFVEPDTPVTDVLATMRRRYINSVIVNKSVQNPEYGILTSTDICDKIVALDRDPSTIKVSEIMTSPLIMVSEEMPVSECARIMKENRIHHLPVTDEDQTLIGMISATDFLVVAEAMGRSGERALR
jgi:CBS domain-containing protein